MQTRTKEREQFLSDLLVTAIEHCGYGFPGIVEYEPEPDGNPGASFAVIYDRYAVENDEPDSGRTWRVDIDTMARGLGVIRKRGTAGYADWVRELLKADRTNADDGDYDVVGALYVLECALFGKQVYS